MPEVLDRSPPRIADTIGRTCRKHQHHFKEFEIKIAGFGGQGVLLLGQLLTEMGMREGLEVSWLPSYGPEMRSGSAHCHVCLSKERIGSPLISHPDVLIALNELSLRKFAPQVAPGGLILYNSDRLPVDFPLPQARVICLPSLGDLPTNSARPRPPTSSCWARCWKKPSACSRRPPKAS